MSHSALSESEFERILSQEEQEDLIKSVIKNNTNGFIFDSTQQFHSESEYNTNFLTNSCGFNETRAQYNAIDRRDNNNNISQQLGSASNEQSNKIDSLQGKFI